MLPSVSNPAGALEKIFAFGVGDFFVLFAPERLEKLSQLNVRPNYIGMGQNL